MLVKVAFLLVALADETHVFAYSSAGRFGRNSLGPSYATQYRIASRIFHVL